MTGSGREAAIAPGSVWSVSIGGIVAVELAQKRLEADLAEVEHDDGPVMADQPRLRRGRRRQGALAHGLRDGPAERLALRRVQQPPLDGAAFRGRDAQAADGVLVVYDGVTRATRVAKLAPGTLVRVEVIGKLRQPNARYTRAPEQGRLRWLSSA